ncbi:MAG: monovalent cation/H(+) antiporter subunit G [Pseudomonadota bacterium]
MTELLETATFGEIVASAILVGGALFALIAGIGLLRMQDVFMRMHASTKAGTLGVGLIMVGAAIGFDDGWAGARAFGAFVFLLLTAPVAAHMIGRAAYLARTPLSPRTVVDSAGTDTPANGCPPAQRKRARAMVAAGPLLCGSP